MNSITHILAYKYIRAALHDSNIGWMVRICFIGIGIGSFALTLVHAVMHGYEYEIHKKMQGIHAQLIIQAHHHALNAPAIIKYAHAHLPEISSLSPTITQYGLVCTPQQDTMPTLVMVKAIEPEHERATTTLEEKIILASGPHTLTACVHNNSVLIGSALAHQLGITLGDTITFIYAQDTQTRRKKIIMEQSELIIGGIFKTGIDEFDAGALFCSYDLIHQLFPDAEISQINIKLTEHANEVQVKHMIESDMLLTVYSWKELYPALVAALKLEKYAMFMILLLITLVASLNIISLLFMLITQKRAHIALLYMLGACPSIVTRIFMYIGVGIAACASSCGIICAWLVCYFLKRYPCIELPDAYYVTHLPAIVDWPTVLIIFSATMGISVLAVWTTVYRTRNMHIADILRFEG